jgi:UDP-2,3-diacylglucosamine hydrolase
MLVRYAERKESIAHHDYYIFGHRHLPLEVSIGNDASTYIGLGDWVEYQSYGVLEDGVFSLEYFEMPDRTKIVK